MEKQLQIVKFVKPLANSHPCYFLLFFQLIQFDKGKRGGHGVTPAFPHLEKIDRDAFHAHGVDAKKKKLKEVRSPLQGCCGNRLNVVWLNPRFLRVSSGELNAKNKFGSCPGFTP